MCLYVFVDGKLRGVFEEGKIAKAIAFASVAKERSHIYDEDKNVVMFFKRGADAKI